MTDQLRPTVPHTHSGVPADPTGAYGPIAGYDPTGAYGQVGAYDRAAAPSSPAIGFPQPTAMAGHAAPVGYPAPAPAGLGEPGWPIAGGGYGPPPGGSSGGPGPSGRGPGGWVIAVAVLLVVLLLGGLTTVLLMISGSDPAPVAPAPAPTAPAAPSGGGSTAPSTGSGSGSSDSGSAGSSGSGTTGSGSSGRSLSTVFSASTGPLCRAYTPTAGEYVTSRGTQAREVRGCSVAGGGADSGVVFTSWASAADAAAVVSDQSNFPSVDGKTVWTMGGTTQGDWHERRLDDGSCMASLDYTAKPYSVLITAPTCSAVETMFQDVVLPDVAAVPAG